MRSILGIISEYYQRKLDYIIENDHELANSNLADNNNINKLVLADNILKITKLVIIILNVSYFLGFAWYIITDLQAEYYEYLDSVAIEQESMLSYYKQKKT